MLLNSKAHSYFILAKKDIFKVVIKETKMIRPLIHANDIDLKYRHPRLKMKRVIAYEDCHAKHDGVYVTNECIACDDIKKGYPISLAKSREMFVIAIAVHHDRKIKYLIGDKELADQLSIFDKEFDITRTDFFINICEDGVYHLKPILPSNTDLCDISHYRKPSEIDYGGGVIMRGFPEAQ